MQIMMTNAARAIMGKQSLLGGRIVELIRIRSAQLGECQPCMQSRKHDSITDEDVACLIAPGGSQLTEQERLAVEFLDLLSADHHAIDDEVYRELGEVFTAAQIVELGFTCANTMGVHRFIHTLDVFGTSATGDRLRRRPGRHRLLRCPGAGAGMSETVFVTGATGLAGANICKLLIERGDQVRALARAEADTEPLAALGVEVVTGDVTDADDVRRAATGADSAIHCAALLGGASQNLPDFEAVNVQGTKHVLDAGRGARHASGGGRQHRHLLRHRRWPRARGRPGDRRSRARIRTPSPRWRPSRTPWPGPPPARTWSPPTRAPSSAPRRWPATPWVGPASTGCSCRPCASASSGT